MWTPPHTHTVPAAHTRHARADLAEVDRVVIVSEDRLEFAIHMRAQSGKHRTFRCTRKEDYKSWTVGLQQYVGMAQAYYAM